MAELANADLEFYLQNLDGLPRFYGSGTGDSAKDSGLGGTCILLGGFHGLPDGLKR